MPNSALGTANFLLFMDKVFDSVNGSRVLAEEGKSLKCAVRDGSPHVDFWYEAIRVFNSVQYFTPSRTFVPPTVRNWVTTLRGFIYLWQKVKGCGFEFLCPRNLNQDPLENFFGCIRSHGFRNVNPTCSSFISSFKALLINNFMAPHSAGSNCEEDETEGAIDALRQFLLGIEEDDGVTPFPQTAIDANFVLSSSGPTNATHSYIAGYIARQLLRLVGQCPVCRSQLIVNYNSNHEQDVISMRQYTARSLLRPNTQYMQVFSQSLQILVHYLPKLCLEDKLHSKLLFLLSHYIKNNFDCSEHNILQIYFLKIPIFIYPLG